jgi:hypothetical protein
VPDQAAQESLFTTEGGSAKGAKRDGEESGERGSLFGGAHVGLDPVQVVQPVQLAYLSALLAILLGT